MIAGSPEAPGHSALSGCESVTPMTTLPAFAAFGLGCFDASSEHVVIEVFGVVAEQVQDREARAWNDGLGLGRHGMHATGRCVPALFADPVSRVVRANRC